MSNYSCVVAHHCTVGLSDFLGHNYYNIILQQIGQLLEMLFSKQACFDGKRVDATPFSGEAAGKRKHAGKVLAKAGYERLGKEVMCDGATGRQLQARMFIGPCSYQVFAIIFPYT